MNSVITIVSFAVFLVIFLWIGALAAKASDHTETDYLLGNRSFGKFFIALSAGATGNSGWIMVGAVGMAYMMGISALLMPIAYFFGDFLFWMFFPDKINQLSVDRNAQTVPELVGSMAKKPQGKRIVTFIVAAITVIFIGASTSGQFAAAAKTLDVFFGVNPTIGTFIAAGAILVYCVTGGLRASIWTDVVQAFVVIFVSLGMLIVALVAGGGVSEIIAQLNAIDPQLTSFTAGFTSWTLLAYLVGYFFFGFGFDLSQPHVLVRLLASRSPEEAKQARWIYLAYLYSTWTAMVLFGVISRALIPAIDDPEQALAFYAMQNFPPVLVGIVLAGVFSVIASTADSQLLVCSSALARDISPALYRKMSRKYGVKYEQGMTLVVGIVAAIATIYISASVFTLVLFGAGAVSASIGPAMLILLIHRRTNYKALSAMMVAGVMTTAIWRILGYSNILYEVCPGFIVALLVHEVLMRFVFPPANKPVVKE
ncbi:sodium/proline symporter [Oscillatoria sp. HE19RPO]|uniref:sodium/proline symporter n=1 Tax=Oscillatoria sp. HE19RPO TaxID=2954806 RepID=UPI0020C38870|nr:sodium/proline symporter [Oscillatoria sp. HE19RPO]